MSEPKLIHHSEKVVTMASLHDICCRKVEMAFKRQGYCFPIWAVADVECGYRVVETPWENGHEQYASRDMIKSMIEVGRAPFYCFAHEGYRSQAIGKDEGEAMQEFLNAGGRLSDLIGDPQAPVVDEVLTVWSHSATGESLNSMYLINSKRPNKKPFLGIRVDNEIDPNLEMHGKMVDLYRNPYITKTAHAIMSRYLDNRRKAEH